MVKHFRRSFILALCALLLIQACSQTERYKVLSFFFDGVPPPGQGGPGKEGAGPEATGEDESLTVQQRIDAAFRTRIYSHPPYRDNQCGECHDMTRDRLVQEPEDGLCMRCHENLLLSLRYAHGPAAVNACLECHHFHFSKNPGMTLESGDAICTGCHAPQDLLPVPQHEEKEKRCLDCHDPHGGEDPYFVRRQEP